VSDKGVVDGGWNGGGIVASSSSTEFALPSGPNGVKAPVLARGQLAELIERLLGELEDVVGDSQAVVVKDGEEVVRVDASTWSVRHEEPAFTGWCKCVNIKVAFTLVVRPRCLHNHNPALNESDRDGTVAQHGKMK